MCFVASYAWCTLADVHNHQERLLQNRGQRTVFPSVETGKRFCKLAAPRNARLRKIRLRGRGRQCY